MKTLLLLPVTLLLATACSDATETNAPIDDLDTANPEAPTTAELPEDAPTPNATDQADTFSSYSDCMNYVPEPGFLHPPCILSAGFVFHDNGEITVEVTFSDNASAENGIMYNYNTAEYGSSGAGMVYTNYPGAMGIQTVVLDDTNVGRFSSSALQIRAMEFYDFGHPENRFSVHSNPIALPAL